MALQSGVTPPRVAPVQASLESRLGQQAHGFAAPSALQLLQSPTAGRWVLGTTLAALAGAVGARQRSREGKVRDRGLQVLVRRAEGGDSSPQEPAPGQSDVTGEDDSVQALKWEDDSALFAALRKRAQELEASGQEQATLIAKNWSEGRAEVRPVVLADDWVRRVTLMDDDLFVGTASSGVRHYRIRGKEAELVKKFRVKGNCEQMVPADHQGGADPETSITSLAWDGCYLAAGLAGSKVQLWDAEGTLILDAPVAQQGQATYVLLIEGYLYAACGRYLRRWRLSAFRNAVGETDPNDQEGAVLADELGARAHCLAVGPNGTVVVGLGSGAIELRDAETLARIGEKVVHENPVSAVLLVKNSLVTGDARGEVISWKFPEDLSSTSMWEPDWRCSKHTERIVQIALGGGDVLLTGALDGSLRTWQADTGREIYRMGGHKVWLGSVIVTPDKGTMVTDGRDNAVYLYDFRPARSGVGER